MSRLVRLLTHYADIGIDIKRLIAAEFFLQLVNSAFTLSLNLYMTKQGYTDIEIAAFTADRFMVVMLFALPFGLYIKGKRLRPIFLAGTIASPFVSLALLEAVSHHADFWLRILLILWGVCFTAVAIPSLPYILRNAPPQMHTRAISLHAATWSMGLIVTGAFIFLLSHLSPSIFDDKALLQLFAIIGSAALICVWRMSKHEQTGNLPTPTLLPKNTEFANFKQKKGGSLYQLHRYIGQFRQQYDWHLIGRAVIPTTLIAVGAGLTIPFMNLFFYHRFGINTDRFALLGSVTALLVLVTTLLVPSIKKRFGYKAIPISQMAAIASLVALGTTDFMNHYWFALPLALFCFVIRQPLMSLANPMTSELTMYYVGNNNRELTGSLMSAIWSGSWFISSYLFGILRGIELHYGTIFFITAAFYLVGVAMYILLIKDYNYRKKAGLTMG